MILDRKNNKDKIKSIKQKIEILKKELNKLESDSNKPKSFKKSKFEKDFKTVVKNVKKDFEDFEDDEDFNFEDDVYRAFDIQIDTDSEYF